jgi:hypothetical protein
MDKPKLRSKKPEVSEELFIRVNDFIELANRIGRRYDTAHAQIALTHAFARYGAYHYRSTVKNDTPEERQAYIEHVTEAVKTLLSGHMADLAGELPRPGAGDSGKA